VGNFMEKMWKNYGKPPKFHRPIYDTPDKPVFSPFSYFIFSQKQKFSSKLPTAQIFIYPFEKFCIRLSKGIFPTIFHGFSKESF